MDVLVRVLNGRYFHILQIWKIMGKMQQLWYLKRWYYFCQWSLEE